MIPSLTELGLSKDIEKYWKSIGYDITPEEYVRVITNISIIPAYKKIKYLEGMLSDNDLNNEYTKYLNNLT